MISLSNLNRFSTFFHWLILLYICSKKHKNPITPYVCCHTTWWIINIKKQATNDALPGSVATYLRCGGVVNNQIKKGLLLTLSLKKIKIREYLAKLQARRRLSCAPGQHTAKSQRKCTTQSTFFLFLCQICTDFNFFSLTESAINLSQFGYC